MLVFNIPTINDIKSHYDILFDIFESVRQNPTGTFSIDFSHCGFLQQNAVAFLGGMARYIEAEGGVCLFLWDTLVSIVRINLQRNGFEATFGEVTTAAQGNSIPYREDRTPAHDSIVDYLRTQWLGRGWVRFSRKLKDLIIGTTWEIYANAFQHAQSEIGIFTCGQHYPKINKLKLTVVDFGVGIPYNVRNYQNDASILSETALRWAFQRGASTQSIGHGRGLGLDILSSFVKLNQGKLEIYSHEGYVAINRHRSLFEDRVGHFPGTIVSVTILCDANSYILAGEDKSAAIF